MIVSFQVRIIYTQYKRFRFTRKSEFRLSCSHEPLGLSWTSLLLFFFLSAVECASKRCFLFARGDKYRFENTETHRIRRHILFLKVS